MSKQLSQEQIHTLTAYGYYYEWTVRHDTFVGRSILNDIRWKIIHKGNDIFDVYVYWHSEWKKLRSVIEIESTYGVLHDFEDVWCKHHPEPKRRK